MTYTNHDCRFRKLKATIAAIPDDKHPGTAWRDEPLKINKLSDISNYSGAPIAKSEVAGGDSNPTN